MTTINFNLSSADNSLNIKYKYKAEKSVLTKQIIFLVINYYCSNSQRRRWSLWWWWWRGRSWTWCPKAVLLWWIRWPLWHLESNDELCGQWCRDLSSPCDKSKSSTDYPVLGYIHLAQHSCWAFILFSAAWICRCSESLTCGRIWPYHCQQWRGNSLWLLLWQNNSWSL